MQYGDTVEHLKHIKCYRLKEKFPSQPLNSPSLNPPRRTKLSLFWNQDWKDSFKYDLVFVPLTFWSEGWEIWSSCSMWLVFYNEFSLLVIVSFCNSWMEIQPSSSLFIVPPL
jgi:hypothetical protein